MCRIAALSAKSCKSWRFVAKSSFDNYLLGHEAVPREAPWARVAIANDPVNGGRGLQCEGHPQHRGWKPCGSYTSGLEALAVGFGGLKSTLQHTLQALAQPSSKCQDPIVPHDGERGLVRVVVGRCYNPDEYPDKKPLLDDDHASVRLSGYANAINVLER
ncbi:hypothetical protein [Pseudomonas sp. PA15(2017)]|uniref:hypothetical protein n=1 Tax=Pseudomonas sp. PA15(2017) TaxID=1932111 RepID=UPI00117AC083|nr:hypothetical protein [Pseudomonas sp. PA15(2017)]